MEHKCNKERELDQIHANVSEIKADVKELLKFKWQVLAVSGMIASIASFIFSKVF